MNIYVREIDTDEVVRTIEVPANKARLVDKIVGGLLINMSSDYYVDDSEFNEPEDRRQPCGHPVSSIVASGEGTHWCRECEA